MNLSQPQYDFLSCSADWALFGGAAGGGKTHAISLDPLRHCQGPSANPMFRGAIFRRTFPDLTQPGGLLDHCKQIYEPLGAVYNHTSAEFRFQCGAKISLETLQYSKDLNSFLGAQFDALYVDEAASFTLNQIMFLWSRCRSKSGVKPVLRMSANPDNDSFLFKLIYWWLDPATGFPDQSKKGVIRHFVATGEDFEWFDEPQFDPTTGERISTSMTFIPSKLSDNKALQESDPAYRRRLLQLPESDRQRFLDGCWLASSSTGSEWPREFFLDLYVEEDQYPIPENRNCVRMFTVDPSKGRSVKEGDYSAIVCNCETNDLAYIDADLARRHPSQIIEDLFLFCEKPIHRIGTNDMIGIESLQFQSLFRDMIQIYAKEHPEYALSKFLHMGNPIIPVEDTLPKAMRIRRLDGPIRSRRLRFLKNPGTTLLLQQLKQFDGQDKKGKHDDGPDALDMARQLPRHLELMYEKMRKGK